jgi:antitoxin (DNA-binding transcriptional repressor) of toxin-antitoxin stability system
MKRLTATVAARQFSDLLDRVEHDGETFVVERRGRAVASITPAVAADGKTIKELLRSQRPDPDWERELSELRALAIPEDRRWDG